MYNSKEKRILELLLLMDWTLPPSSWKVVSSSRHFFHYFSFQSTSLKILCKIGCSSYTRIKICIIILILTQLKLKRYMRNKVLFIHSPTTNSPLIYKNIKKATLKLSTQSLTNNLQHIVYILIVFKPFTYYLVSFCCINIHNKVLLHVTKCTPN